MNTPSEGVSLLAARGDPVALCQIMVAIPSVNPELEAGGAGEEALARRCGQWLEGWGYGVQLSEASSGRWNVLAQLGQGQVGKRLILSGHLDTVGVEGMSSDPFGGEVRGGMVWGRGACDMKGGLAIILATAARAATSGGIVGPESDGALIIALSADEEHASIGMQELVEAGLEGDAAVVCEPTSLSIMPAHKGFLWIDAEFQGCAAHGSRPEEGVDAIQHAGCYLAALTELESRLCQGPEHPLLGFPSFHAGTIEGGTAPSVYPQACKLVLERRTLPGEDPEAVLKAFQEVLDSLEREVPKLKGSLKPGLFRPGTEVSAESPLVRLLASCLEAEGIQPRIEGMTAWVETAFLNEAGIPAVCFGPGSIAQAHAAVEWIPVEELEVGAQVLYRFAEEFLKQEVSEPLGGTGVSPIFQLDSED